MAIDLAGDAGLFLADFAESVVYRPRTGAPRTIQAIVDRSPPGPIAEAPGAQAPTLRLDVLNDSEAGIRAADLDTGGDRVDVAVRPGGPVTTRRIVLLLDGDEAMLRLEVR